MSIRVGGDIGFEMHPDIDQIIRIEKGNGIVVMGDSRELMNIQENISDDMAFIIPAGKWHNVINTGDSALKLYSIYAPIQHPHGTVQQTKEIAQLYENNYNRYYQKNSSY
jgi:mannose-6-phosphate isomerase-like protein (cupin superfamily)